MSAAGDCDVVDDVAPVGSCFQPLMQISLQSLFKFSIMLLCVPALHPVYAVHHQESFPQFLSFCATSDFTNEFPITFSFGQRMYFNLR